MENSDDDTVPTSEGDLQTVVELLAEILEQLRVLNDNVIQLAERFGP